MSLTGKHTIATSQYDNSLPYTYEARLPIVDGDDIYNSYFADTICGLIEYLHRHNVRPNQVSIFEIYQEEEFPIDAELFTGADNTWMFKPAICRSFQEHYKGHIEDGKCSFRDRDRSGCGP